MSSIPLGWPAALAQSPAPTSLDRLQYCVFSKFFELEKILAEEYPNKCVQCETAALSVVSVWHDRLNECFVTVTGYSLGWTAPTCWPGNHGLELPRATTPAPPALPGHVVNPLRRTGCPPQSLQTNSRYRHPGDTLGLALLSGQNWEGRDVVNVSGQDERTGHLAEGQDSSRPGWLRSWHSGPCLQPEKVAVARSGALTSFSVVAVQRADLGGRKEAHAAWAFRDLPRLSDEKPPPAVRLTEAAAPGVILRKDKPDAISRNHFKSGCECLSEAGVS